MIVDAWILRSRHWSMTVCPVITISLRVPRALAAQLESQAEARQQPKSALVREHIERGLQSAGSRPASFHDLASDKCGIGHSRRRYLATNARYPEDYGH